MRHLISSVLLFGIVMLSGCIVPIPHQRLHELGVVGHVYDSRLGAPLKGVKIEDRQDPKRVTYSDAGGSFRLRPVYGWHGAYFIGPVSLSLFPGFDMPVFYRSVLISADGYRDFLISPTSLSLTNDYIQINIPMERK